MEATANDSAASPVAERLREFLRSLPPETCVRILDALHRASAAGESFAGAELISTELATVIQAHRRRPPRAGNPQRYFFALIEPFLIDEALADKCPARIERASLPPLWTWLARDLVPDQVATYERAVLDALALQDADKARALASRFQKAVTPVIKAALAGKEDDTAERRLVGQLGGPRVHEDVRDIVLVLENRDALKTVGERIAGPIRHLDETHASVILAAMGPHARGRASLIPHAVAIAMTRLAQPCQIVRVAALAADSHEVAKIANTPLAVVVDLLLADVERLVVRADLARKARDVEKLATAARDFAVHVRALVTDLEMAPDLPAAKRTGLLRARMAQILKPEIETLPGRVRRILKSRPPARPGSAEGLDTHEIASIEAGLDILLVAKSQAAELALNEVTLRVFSDLQTFLDAGVNPLLDGVRTMVGEDRAFRLQQLDAAVKIAHRVLGATYATLLAKAVDVAAGDKRASQKTA